MKALARSIIEAVSFLELSGDDVVDPDSAVKAMESVAYELARITAEEKSALNEALGELIEEERSRPGGSPPGGEVIEFYRSFMESFGLEEE